MIFYLQLVLALLYIRGGYLFGEYSKYIKFKLSKALEIIVNVVLSILCVIALLIFEKKGHISLLSNSYNSPLFLVISSSVGIILLLSLSNILVMNNLLRKTISYVGRNTIFILFLHFISFRLVNILQVLIQKREWYEVATFPHIHSEDWWWVGYSICGICIPLVLSALWNKLKYTVHNFNSSKTKGTI